MHYSENMAMKINFMMVVFYRFRINEPLCYIVKYALYYLVSYIFAYYIFSEQNANNLILGVLFFSQNLIAIVLFL